MAPSRIRTPASLATSSTLRALREQRELGLRELARRLGFSASMLSSYELGHNEAKPTMASRILGCLHVQGTEYDQLMYLAANIGTKNFVDHTTSPTTDLLSIYENLSTRIVEWSPFRIPDLLRTPRWLQTTAEGDVEPSDQLDQEPFHQRCRRLPAQQEGRSYVFLIGDQALRMACEDAGPATQDLDLLRGADKRIDVSIRVAPSGPAALNPTTAFTVFESGRLPLAVALRHEHCTAYLTEESLRISYQLTAKNLLKRNSGESATLETWIAATYDRTSS